MHFGWTTEQELLRSTAREFLERECPISRVREWMEDSRGYSPEVWAKLAELGWLGLLIPEAYGGSGLGFVDLTVILEETGRSLLPSPFLATLQGTLAVLRAGNPTPRKEILGGVAAGERILSFAITEESGTEDARDLETRATRDGSGYRVTGTKLFVPDGQNADQIVVVARTGGAGESGISLLLVDREAPGLEVRPLESIDHTRRIAELRFDGVRAELLGEDLAGWNVWRWVRDRALVALAAEAVGGVEKVLEDSVAYAKQRVQFGKPIGVNQAIKHKCADMLIDLESSRSITHYAAWHAAEDLEQASLFASMAKAFTSDAYRRASAENIQIHGGVGFTWEYDCHLYFRRAKAIEVTYGDSVHHREQVAELLDLS
ncbi:MAG: acyl-CoA dehydrogenase family protein [Myxococcota bacterium]|nr:acyl-CoA dehydrogenase family protein [Myxococcota bacterium]